MTDVRWSQRFKYFKRAYGQKQGAFSSVTPDKLDSAYLQVIQDIESGSYKSLTAKEHLDELRGSL
ncbi:hypothetical protein [Oceanospirillum sp.]|uniref:hypothetical protein n=1 Tax=Oceanospirillum sp. TaxID=2021254 RepID=UPI003A9331D5